MKALRRSDLDRFFRELANRLPIRVRLVLTGGAEAMLLGGSRPTADLDFEVALPRGKRAKWPEVEAAIEEAARVTGIVVQYSENVDRWSPVAVPARHRKSRPYVRTGRLSVHLLDPVCWAIYKIARYLESDRQDVVRVLRTERIPAGRIARLAGESLRESPRSSALYLFRKQFEHLVRNDGPEIWGARFDAEGTLSRFRKAAGIPDRRRV